MVSLCKRAVDMSDETLMGFVTEAYPIIAFCKQLENKERRLMEIMECEILADGTRRYRPLFQYQITHFASIVQRPDGFRIDRDCRRLMEWKPNGTMRLHPFELIQQESGIQVRYRYDWHIGAMPERYTYDKTGQKQPLNELALDLIPGDYGRAICNGRFRDWDTGIWYYVLDILNVMPLTEPTDALTSFMDREPNMIYTQIDRLW